MKIRLEEALRISREDAIPVPGNRKITATWSGGGWCLCRGEWTITVGDEEVELPEEVRRSDMNTAGTYRRWYFGGESGREEQYEFYDDGLEFEPWLKANSWWIDNLNLSAPEKRDLYDAISEQDWRHGSCGGCI